MIRVGLFGGWAKALGRVGRLMVGVDIGDLEKVLAKAGRQRATAAYAEPERHLARVGRGILRDICGELVRISVRVGKRTATVTSVVQAKLTVRGGNTKSEGLNQRFFQLATYDFSLDKSHQASVG